VKLMTGGKHFTLAVLALTVLANCSGGPVAPAAAPTGPYSALNALPDWSGSWWTADVFSTVSAIARTEPSPLKPGDLAKLRATFTAFGTKPIRFKGYCYPAMFGGNTGGVEGNIEFLFTPGRVTIAWEGGLVRRIYTDGRALPPDPDESNAGYSVGHWEDRTLVVKTVSLKPNANLVGAPFLPKLGAGASVDERIVLIQPGVIEFDVTINAPQGLARPLHTKWRYQRAENYVMGDFSRCVEGDRGLNTQTGEVRFDLTPPKDLPPPPPG
jgi:hypothetical protein